MQISDYQENLKPANIFLENQTTKPTVVKNMVANISSHTCGIQMYGPSLCSIQQTLFKLIRRVQKFGDIAMIVDQSVYQPLKLSKIKPYTFQDKHYCIK